jgi:beta-aspartyl-peptidase (threonine type)
MAAQFQPAIIVHGGAGRIRRAELAERLNGCRDAAFAGWRILRQGGPALDAVETAVMVLEDNPLFNAGTGSTLNSLGKIEMDAAIMAGEGLRAGAVAAVSSIKNPIQLARRIMEDGRHVLLASDGALRFAGQSGVPLCDPETLVVATERDRWRQAHGTVGCVAFDRAGKIAAGTSTGGTFGKLPGRVGDSPLIGCGTCVDQYGGASCTGDGEAIMRIVMAKTALGYLRQDLGPGAAANAAVSRLAELTGAGGGLILIDGRGEVAYARNTEHMPICSVTGEGDVRLDS